MVFGAPHVRTGRVFADIEVVVVVAFVAGVEMENRGPQTQRRQQPRLEVVELGPAGRGTGQIQPPRPHGVGINGPHNALRIGVGAGTQVERLVLRRMDGVTSSISGAAGFSSAQTRRRRRPARPACPCRTTRPCGGVPRTDPGGVTKPVPNAVRRPSPTRRRSPSVRASPRTAGRAPTGRLPGPSRRTARAGPSRPPRTAA